MVFLFYKIFNSIQIGSN